MTERRHLGMALDALGLHAIPTLTGLSGAVQMDPELVDNLVDRVAIGVLLRRRSRDSGGALVLADYSTVPPPA